MERELWMNLRGRDYGGKEGGILELGQDGGSPSGQMEENVR